MSLALMVIGHSTALFQCSDWFCCCCCSRSISLVFDSLLLLPFSLSPSVLLLFFFWFFIVSPGFNSILFLRGRGENSKVAFQPFLSFYWQNCHLRLALVAVSVQHLSWPDTLLQALFRLLPQPVFIHLGWPSFHYWDPKNTGWGTNEKAPFYSSFTIPTRSEVLSVRWLGRWGNRHVSTQIRGFCDAFVSNFSGCWSSEKCHISAVDGLHDTNYFKRRWLYYTWTCVVWKWLSKGQLLLL